MVNAEIKKIKGSPTLFIKGKETAPFVFWGTSRNPNREFEQNNLDYNLSVIELSQKKASEFGVNIISLFMWMSPDDEKETVNREVLLRLVKNNPNCYIIPRILLPRVNSEILETDKKDDECYSDGMTSIYSNQASCDFISDSYRAVLFRCIKNFINMVKNDIAVGYAKFQIDKLPCETIDAADLNMYNCKKEMKEKQFQ